MPASIQTCCKILKRRNAKICVSVMVLLIWCMRMFCANNYGTSVAETQARLTNHCYKNFSQTQLLPIRQSIPTWNELNDIVTCLPGGEWAPADFETKILGTDNVLATAIIIPYRSRETQLRRFLLHMHKYLKFQCLHYRIFTITQVSQQTFNRAKLINVGFIEAQKYGNFNCFVMHDVDLLPINLGVPYNCSSLGPLHMSSAINKFDWRLPYKQSFGGVTSFTKEQFIKMNGMSNKYWGWGAEDDDAYRRVAWSRQVVQRVPSSVGRYVMMRHKRDLGNSPPSRHQNNELLKRAQLRWRVDGIRNVNYTLTQDNSHIFQHYTNILVDLNPSKYV